MKTAERPYDDNDVPEEVEYGLAFAYGRNAAPSVLDEISALTGERPSISLRDLDPAGETPLPKPLSLDDARSAGPDGKYIVQGVLAQGGIGTVHRGHDQVLGRDVAMKFLNEQYKDRPEALHRFVEEAQIGGQLQHPGIVPVHELGMSGGRPFFAMELVRGQTLARCLAERSSPESDRRRFLSIFEAVCQTMAYAHARGVVHRDLKPANIMIGAFGEVQVVDWGMGKVLEQGGVADERRAAELRSEAVETVRSSEDGSKSVLGSVMGTPAYMPPEQARGDIDRMDERSDVFALGAILCEILTCQPPYVGPQKELLGMAADARLEDAHARLSRCLAETELVELSRNCLAPAPGERPRSAKVVARAMQDYLSATEQRAHHASVRAAALKRTQKLGIVLTAVIGLGLATSLWFWRDADVQRKLAETNLANFDLLSHVVRLETVKGKEPALYPAWPETVQAMQDWLGEANKLRAALPDLRATLAAVEARALPQTKAARDEERRTHPRLAELANLRRKLEALQRAQAVRTGSAQPESFQLDDSKIPKTPRRLRQRAWPLISPGRKEFGREAEALALARRAASLGPYGSERAKVLHTLAWALFANGLDEDAVDRSRAALEAVSDSGRIVYASRLKRLEAAVAAASGAKGQAAIDEVAAAVTKLQAEVQRRRNWEFADPLDQFLHSNLNRLLMDIEPFTETIAGVERRLAWAECVEELTITRYKKRWEEARLAILAADGVTASKLYAGSRLDLQPQVGLVPIGPNPKTRLWEFYHLRSGWDPDKETDPAKVPIPRHDRDAKLDIVDRGIVFVLIPGGRFHMGAQSRDRGAANYDPMAGSDERPVQEVELQSYFLSKYEMTQGQWARLTGGEYPSHYKLGNGYLGIPVGPRVPIGDDHPVEHVSWEMCDEVFRQHGLVLPTEAQWEHGCRAGTASPWFTGKESDTLVGFANVMDQSAIKTYPRWAFMAAGKLEEFEDGYAGPAPVGSYAPNAFGLFDVHGNVFEWVRDWYGSYTIPARATDGLREPGSSSGHRIARGGTYEVPGRYARSAVRSHTSPQWQDDGTGVRPARVIRR